MKKYRLYELCPVGDSNPIEIGDFNTYEEAVLAMRRRLSCIDYYRIKEVEESIKDRVKTVADAVIICEQYGWAEDVRKYISAYITSDNSIVQPPFVTAFLSLCEVTAALNEGWKPDWEDASQKKWVPRFQAVLTKGETQTIEFIEADWEYFTEIPMSSRLYFKSRELAEYAATQFAELYKQLLIEKF